MTCLKTSGNSGKFILAVSLCLGFSFARAWDPNKPFIYEMKIAFETDNWTNHYSTTTVLSKSDNTVAFQVVANSTTSPTYQLVVTTQGNVGIGTASPSQNLEVAGSGKFSGSSHTYLFLNSPADDKEAGMFFGRGGTNKWELHIPTSGNDLRLYNYDNGANVFMVQNNTGNVGIRTTTPRSPLEINVGLPTAVPTGTGTTGLMVTDGSSIYGRIGVINLWSSTGEYPTYIQGGLADTAAYYSLLLEPNGGNVGIGTTNPTYKLYVNGSAYCTGSWQSSDARWKKNVAPVSGALDKVLELRGVTFDWRSDEFPAMNFSTGTQIGFIAQEVKKVFPQVVSTDSSGFMAVSYERLVPVLTEALKEEVRRSAARQAEVETLKAENAGIKKRLSALEQNRP